MCEFEDNDSKGQDFENTFYTLMKHMLRIIAETQKWRMNQGNMAEIAFMYIFW